MNDEQLPFIVHRSSFIVHRSSFLRKAHKMKKLAVLLFLAASTAYAQISFENLAAIHRIGAPQISPDGKTIAYDVSTPDLAANRSQSAVFLMSSSGGQPTRIADGRGPVWSPDG